MFKLIRNAFRNIKEYSPGLRPQIDKLDMEIKLNINYSAFKIKEYLYRKIRHETIDWTRDKFDKIEMLTGVSVRHDPKSYASVITSVYMEHFSCVLANLIKNREYNKVVREILGEKVILPTMLVKFLNYINNIYIYRLDNRIEKTTINVILNEMNFYIETYDDIKQNIVGLTQYSDIKEKVVPNLDKSDFIDKIIILSNLTKVMFPDGNVLISGLEQLNKADTTNWMNSIIVNDEFWITDDESFNELLFHKLFGITFEWVIVDDERINCDKLKFDENELNEVLCNRCQKLFFGSTEPLVSEVVENNITAGVITKPKKIKLKNIKSKDDIKSNNKETSKQDK